MGTLTVVEDVTLDGVMQAPGRPDEDRRGGFPHGGWALPYFDDVKMRVMGEGMAKASSGGSALLFGRRTFDDFAGYWPHQTDNPFTAVLDATPKYVVSRTRSVPPAWRGSTMLTGEAAETVARLKRESTQDLTVLGSGELVRTLVEHDLVDEYVLSIHALLLGTGTRLFANAGQAATLRLVESVTTTTGVVIATYRPATRPAPAPGGA